MTQVCNIGKEVLPGGVETFASFANFTGESSHITISVSRLFRRP